MPLEKYNYVKILIKRTDIKNNIANSEYNKSQAIAGLSPFRNSKNH